jgi:hypothetical protein
MIEYPPHDRLAPTQTGEMLNLSGLILWFFTPIIG